MSDQAPRINPFESPNWSVQWRPHVTTHWARLTSAETFEEAVEKMNELRATHGGPPINENGWQGVQHAEQAARRGLKHRRARWQDVPVSVDTQPSWKGSAGPEERL